MVKEAMAAPHRLVLVLFEGDYSSALSKSRSRNSIN